MGSSDPQIWMSPQRTGQPVLDKIFQSLTEWLAGHQIQTGSFSATIASGTNFINKAITYPNPFPTATDFVAVTNTTGGFVSANAQSPSASGFTASVFTTAGTNEASNTTINLLYIAVGH